MKRPLQVRLEDVDRYPDLIDRVLDGPPKPISPRAPENHWTKLKSLALRKDGKVMKPFRG